MSKFSLYRVVEYKSSTKDGGPKVEYKVHQRDPRTGLWITLEHWPIHNLDFAIRYAEWLRSSKEGALVETPKVVWED